MEDLRVAHTARRHPASDGQTAADGVSGQSEILLNRYRVLSRRGTGGFGTVCTCWDTRLQRRVAIKRMPLTDATTSAGVLTSTTEEALAEARTASLLAHPNIVTVHDFETDGAYAYLVMEFIDGLNLSELLARVEGGVLTHDEAACLVSALGRALGYAHENGVLHLDIKPTNIMIDRQGTVKLADFGMATLASATGYGDARGGTVGYMPPEQIEGFLVDERADVFSLAVVMRQALTGHNIFFGRDAKESLNKILKTAHSRTSASLAKEDQTLSLSAIDHLESALSSDSSHRPADISEFADCLSLELGNAQAGEQSLKNLIEQSEEEEDESWENTHIPFFVRHPKVIPACSRALALCVTAELMFFILRDLVPSSLPFQIVAVSISAAAAALWPPLGSALVLSTFVYALATISPTSVSFPLAALLVLFSIVWWIGAGRTDRFATGAGLLPAALFSSVATPALAGAALRPLPAFLTGLFGFVFGVTFTKALSLHFVATPLSYELISSMSLPSFWILCAGNAFSALIASYISKKRTRGLMLFGQLLGLIVLISSIILAVYVKNKSFWPTMDWASIVFAVTLCVLVCLGIVLTGPDARGREGEDIDELY
ncbi:serine/threonine-protein kinase [Atopobium sp. oral taxon 199]|uniref:serine/threonine-protein kinase n=1 Tax=Atopobium sp. oral taxon 199 TaxID=712156 RepID=UPI00034E3727|nr:serine/threonine-protein kinase [Atopobium sp. oral taxon 199]EPD78697.1 hypothetical protein HMPREF1527_01026 [Atopobium sp. oral taxon 199 str. F0494]